MNRMILLIECLMGFLFLLCACDRRPLVESDGGLLVQVVIDVRDVQNVYTGIYNEEIPVPGITPELMRILFYDAQTHELVAEDFIHEQHKDEDGRQLIEGKVKIRPGVYDMLCYNFDVASTLVRNDWSWDEIEAFTEILSEDRFSSLPHGVTKERIQYEPDHLVAARERGLRIDRCSANQHLRVQARTVIDTYFLQVPVTGASSIAQASAVLTGLSSSNHFALNKRNDEPASAIWFDMRKSKVSDEQGGEKQVLCAVFNTFGKIPVQNSLLKLEIVTHDGRVIHQVIEMQDVFHTEDAVQRHWLLVEEVLVIPDPLFPPDGGGGFEPGVDDWEHEYGQIDIR